MMHHEVGKVLTLSPPLVPPLPPPLPCHISCPLVPPPLHPILPNFPSHLPPRFHCSLAVPNYLRTKLSLDLERKQRERWEESEKEGVATTEKIKRFNQMLTSALDRVNELKEEVEERRTRTGVFVCLCICVHLYAHLFVCL